MKLTNKGRYAVMAMAELAKHDIKKPINLSEISIRQGISISFLGQIFLKLKNKDLVQSSRGPSGGYILSKPPEEIKLSNIIEAVDEKVKTLKCKKDSKKGCNGKSIKCITHDLWAELEHHIMYFFEKNTLKDIVSKTTNKFDLEIKK
jgi:Rrf2 family iron-sulfur cluster assembly transcriptional regulator